MNKDEFLSLYDYLGEAAGSKLGKEVNDYAQATNQPIRTREISNPKFTGKVMLYTKEFLDNYFENQEQKKIKLPF